MATIKKEYILKIEMIMPASDRLSMDKIRSYRGVLTGDKYMRPDSFETIFRGGLTSDETINLMKMIIKMRGGER